MKHVRSGDQSTCEMTSSAGMIAEVTRSIFGQVDCEDCLRRAIAEGEERTRVLRELLAIAGSSS